MGEACTAANRFYVHSSVGEAFSTRLAERMAALKMGNGLDEEVAVGPLVNAEARSEEHTSELQSLMRISYAVFCLKKKKTEIKYTITTEKYYEIYSTERYIVKLHVIKPVSQTTQD